MPPTKERGTVDPRRKKIGKLQRWAIERLLDGPADFAELQRAMGREYGSGYLAISRATKVINSLKVLGLVVPDGSKYKLTRIGADVARDGLERHP